jgi:hypothetical protein
LVRAVQQKMMLFWMLWTFTSKNVGKTFIFSCCLDSSLFF